MQSNMLNDLAKAMKALDGKKACAIDTPTIEDREDCYGRATVALTRAIRHTYIVSPIDMAGMIGMAQTLAVYHYGHYTLKNRQVQFHSPAREPSDVEAVLEWGLNTPFTSQDKPPLAVAMVVTLNGVCSLRRYRLVIAQKSKLRLTPEVGRGMGSPIPGL